MEAISLLETVPASRELARAYALLGHLHNEVEKRREAKAWAARAIELGQQLGAHDVVIRATTDFGTAELFDGAPRGWHVSRTCLCPPARQAWLIRSAASTCTFSGPQ